MPYHTYIGMAVIKRFLGHHSPMDMSSLHKENQKVLKKYLVDLESADTQMAVTLLPFFKISKTYTDGYRIRCTCHTGAQSASLAWFLLRVEDAQDNYTLQTMESTSSFQKHKDKATNMPTSMKLKGQHI